MFPDTNSKAYPRLSLRRSRRRVGGSFIYYIQSYYDRVYSCGRQRRWDRRKCSRKACPSDCCKSQKAVSWMWLSRQTRRCVVPRTDQLVNTLLIIVKEINGGSILGQWGLIVRQDTIPHVMIVRQVQHQRPVPFIEVIVLPNLVRRGLIVGTIINLIVQQIANRIWAHKLVYRVLQEKLVASVRMEEVSVIHYRQIDSPASFDSPASP